MEELKRPHIRRLMAAYLEALEAENYSPRTVEGYRDHLKRFVDFLGGMDEVDGLGAVTGELMHRYQLHVHGETIKGHPLSISTQQSRLVAVRGFFRHMARRGLILSDPCGGLELPRSGQTLPRHVMTSREVERLLNAPDVDELMGLRDRAVMELLYSTGMRNAELRALNVGDVDLANGQAAVRQGKGRRDRMVPLGDVAAVYVRRYVDDARPALVRDHEPTAALFVNYRGERLGDSGLIYNVVGKYVRLSGLPAAITPHVFRHTCATHMLKGRANIRHIQELLGHKCLVTTQRYTRVEISDLKREHRRCHPRERTR